MTTAYIAGLLLTIAGAVYLVVESARQGYRLGRVGWLLLVANIGVGGYYADLLIRGAR